MKKHHHWLALGFALAVVASVQAQSTSSDQARLQQRVDHSPACESARLSAWFDQQRQLTDGAVDPHAAIATPIECASGGPQAAAEAAPTTTAQRGHTDAPMHKGPRG